MQKIMKKHKVHLLDLIEEGYYTRCKSRHLKMVSFNKDSITCLKCLKKMTEYEKDTRMGK